MKRKLYEQLQIWKEDPNRLPLVLKGARQVGKSFLLEHFGENEFDKCFHFDFEKDKEKLADLFSGNLDPKTILYNLSLLVGENISVQNDLIIFDEIQNCSKALTSLKYFAEELPQLHICAAGSLLGIHLSDESFPVGKVNFLELLPMTFGEFLWTYNNQMLLEVYNSAIYIKQIPLIAHKQLWSILKEYYVVGGMPGVVAAFLEFGENKIDGMNAARKKQKELIASYKADFKKHAGPLNALHIINVFEKIPQQLASHLDDAVKRFRFKDVIPGKRHFIDLEGPINWLEKAGLVYKVYPCTRVEEPLISFTKDNIFKLFILDVGILGAMLDLSPETLILQDYGITKGFFAENLVAGELIASGHEKLFCFFERNYEVDFLFYHKSSVIPVEVKAGNRKSVKSLKYFINQYNPDTAILISAGNLNIEKSQILSCPLYLITQFMRNLSAVKGD